jgi:CheY-like chemotaxis protein
MTASSSTTNTTWRVSADELAVGSKVYSNLAEFYLVQVDRIEFAIPCLASMANKGQPGGGGRPLYWLLPCPYMPLLLLLDDTPGDRRKVVDLARRAGFNELEVYGYPADARLYLENAMIRKVPMPDTILIDLDLNKEDGFALICFWHANQRLKAIPLIVWTTPDKHHREVSKALGVHRTVFKDDDIYVLMEALTSAVPRIDDDAVRPA